MFQHTQSILQQALQDLFAIDLDPKEIPLDLPKYEGRGDVASPIAMKLAKQLKQKPLALAEQLVTHLAGEAFFAEVEVAAPGFLNLRFADAVVSKALEDFDPECQLQPEQVRRIVLDFSHPNIAKPLHFGHFRSTVIGESLVRLLRHAGHEVLADNFLGNWGTNFGKLIVAIDKWGDEEKIKEHPTEELVRLYQKFHEEINELLEKEAAEAFRQMEQEGNELYLEKWKWIVEVTLQELQPFYELLDCHFDVIRGEQFYEQFLSETIKELETCPDVVREEEGALVAKDEKFPTLILQKTDGATLYQTRDMARLRYYEQEGFKESVEVVSNEQSLHFQQIFRLAEKMGWKIEGKHVSFGMVLGLDGKKFSTRKGNGIPLNEVLERAVEKAKEKLKEEQGGLEEVIGIGALKFNDLGQSRQKDIVFDWDRMLDFNGYSGPFLQYSAVRCKSLLRKHDGKIPKKIPAFHHEMERTLALQLLRFPATTSAAAREYSPHILAEYLFDLAGLFNRFYAACPILHAEGAAKEARLFLTEQTGKTLEKGLWLLGIETPERM